MISWQGEWPPDRNLAVSGCGRKRSLKYALGGVGGEEDLRVIAGEYLGSLECMSHLTTLAAATLAMLIAGLCCVQSVAAAAIEPPPAPEQFPSVADLPDPFLLKDGSRVKTKEQWAQHRSELRELILACEYGRLAPAPKAVSAEETASKTDDATGVSEKTFLLSVDPDKKVQVHLVLTSPKGAGPFPTIIKGDLGWGRVKPEIVADVVQHGYALAEFDRTDLAPDQKNASGGVRPLYPDYDWGAIAAWAWGFHRVTDYLLTRPEIDPKKLVYTGHSRGGKAALLAGALDERIALTAPNGSGCGGAGCYRVQPPKTEDIAIILDHFPYWFSPAFQKFIGHVDRLPFDQHTLKALVAPRAFSPPKVLVTSGPIRWGHSRLTWPPPRFTNSWASPIASPSTTAKASTNRMPRIGRRCWTLRIICSRTNPPLTNSTSCPLPTLPGHGRGQRPRQNESPLPGHHAQPPIIGFPLAIFEQRRSRQLLHEA